MLLVLDIGNTNIVIGLFEGDNLIGHWRFSSLDRTGDEAGLLIQSLLDSNRVPSERIDGTIISSVVPRLEEVWTEALMNYLGVKPFIVSPEMDLGMAVEMDNPREVGADRLVNSVAAIAKYGCPVVTVDLGTAITLDVVSSGGAYIGGAIAPGLAASMETLFSKAAKLPQIALTAPGRVIGKNTVSAVQSGIVYGYAGLVDSLVDGVFSELGTSAPVIATGGHAHILASQ
jgi:type III pantothenate kinase